MFPLSLKKLLRSIANLENTLRNDIQKLVDEAKKEVKDSPYQKYVADKDKDINEAKTKQKNL